MTSPRRASPAATSLADLARRIAGFPVVSCDIFDTALLRRLARPEDLHLATGIRAAAAGLITCGPAAYQRYRLEAERAARAAAEAAGDDEPTLAEIHAQLPDFGVAASPSAAAALAALEVAVERSVCVANAPLRAILAARPAGQELVFVSDSTLSAEHLATLLADAGYGAGCRVWSSADARRSKHTGRLFPLVLDALGRRPAEVVHLGDNPHSDIANAAAHGITAIHLPQPGRPPEPPGIAAAHPVVRLAHSHRRSLAARAASPPPAPPRGTAPGVVDDQARLHRYAGNLLLGFTLFVFAEAKRRGIRRIYFLSRDGWLPYLLAQRLGPRIAPDVALEYLHVSRRAIAVPAKTTDLPQLADEVAENNEGQPLATALEFIEIDPTTTAGLLRALGLDPAQRITRASGRGEILRLFTAQRGLIEAKLRARHDAALGYLEQAGFLAPGRRMIVDVGWRGSTQEALARLTGLPAEDLFGCYVGLFPQALRPALNLRNAAGYLFTFGDPQAMLDMVLDGYIVMELLFSSPQTTVLNYAMEGSRAVPVHGTEQDPGASIRRAAIEALERDCLAEWAALDEILGGAWPESIDAASAMLDLARLLTRPSVADVAAINRIPFVQGFSGGQNRVAVSPIPARAWLLHTRATLQRIERAAWRAGAARASLPWPIPSMTVEDLRYRVGRLLRLLHLG